MFRCLILSLLMLNCAAAQASDSLTFPAHTPGSKGTVVVVAPAGAPVDSGRWQRILLRTLPEHGWQTLSVSYSDGPEVLPGLIEGAPAPQFWVLSGARAGTVIAALAERQLPKPQGLVLLGPYLPDSEANAALPGQLAALGIPVLDLNGPGDHPMARATTTERHTANRRSGNPNYRAMTWSLDWDQSPDTLAQRIRGWIQPLQ
ncbi:alpha/beta hydrolase family protein [Marinobacter hydrocarbonoclasticus]|nr:alpha/beta hydrolase family protein [Marinobacter nauticus]